MLMNIENFFLSKLFGGVFYHRFRYLLNEAKINTNNSHHKPNKPIAIKTAGELWLEEEQIMADVYADERGIYINVTKMNDKDEE